MEEEKVHVSFDNESDQEKKEMTIPPRQTMEDYCRRTDVWLISLGFQLANPINFDNDNSFLFGLRDNSFEG